MIDLRREEWIGVAVIVVIIVAINKIAIRDHGSSWGTLLVLSVIVGVGLVHLRRRLQRDRSRHGGNG